MMCDLPTWLRYTALFFMGSGIMFWIGIGIVFWSALAIDRIEEWDG